jgi:biotin carboxylase
MNILILHKRAYQRMRYGEAIDHAQHCVVYIGTEAHLRSIPDDLPCQRIPRPGIEPLVTEVLNLVESWGSRLPRFDLIVAFSELELLDAARLREVLGVPGPRHDDILRVRDKMCMKQVVQRAGLRVPLHVLGTRALDDAPAPWQGRTVLKPVDGAFSENIQVYATAAHAWTAIREGSHGLADFDPSRYELEEFIEGDVIHFDGLVVEGKPRAMLASRYVGTCLKYAAGEPVGSFQFDAGPELLRWARACLAAVELTTASFHLEAILGPEGPVFLEVAGRVAGADVVDCFELATGLHLPSLELRALVEPSALDDLQEPRMASQTFGWFAFPGHHLAEDYCDVIGAEPFLRHPHVLRTSLLSEAARVHKKISYLAGEAPFVGLVAADTAAQLETTMREIFRDVRVVPRLPAAAAG